VQALAQRSRQQLEREEGQGARGRPDEQADLRIEQRADQPRRAGDVLGDPGRAGRLAEHGGVRGQRAVQALVDRDERDRGDEHDLQRREGGEPARPAAQPARQRERADDHRRARTSRSATAAGR
jgi:hypothetical protein